MREILINSIYCEKCGDILISEHEHDFKMCTCGSCGVDGGKNYIRRIGNPENFTELSVFFDEEEEANNDEDFHIRTNDGNTGERIEA